MTTRFGRAHLAEASARFGATALDPARFELWLDEEQYGGVAVSRLGGAAVAFTGMPGANGENVDVAFIEAGELQHEESDGLTWRSASDAVVVAPSWVPRRLRFPGEWSAVLVRVSRTAVEAFAPRLPDALGVFTDRTTLDRAMHAFIAQVGHRDRSPSSLERYAIEQLLTEMTRKRGLTDRIRNDLRYRALLQLWLYFHVPLSFALLAALIAHVVSVFYYW